MINENEMYLTSDFVTKTSVFKITYDESSLGVGEVISQSKKEECTVSRFDPGSKLILSLCYSKENNYVYVGREDSSGQMVQPIIIKSEEDKASLLTYRLLILSSIDNESVNFLVYIKNEP